MWRINKMNEQDYKLCYIDGNCAYFTNNFENQWGDDWNDAPYEHNAGEPYERNYKVKLATGDYEKIKIKTLYFELPRYWNYLPCDHFTNSPYSVEDINKGAVAWIHTKDFNIHAGTKMEDFIDVVKKHGGKVFLEV
jgi:hypothetical protein